VLFTTVIIGWLHTHVSLLLATEPFSFRGETPHVCEASIVLFPLVSQAASTVYRYTRLRDLMGRPHVEHVLTRPAQLPHIMCPHPSAVSVLAPVPPVEHQRWVLVR